MTRRCRNRCRGRYAVSEHSERLASRGGAEPCLICQGLKEGHGRADCQPGAAVQQEHYV